MDQKPRSWLANGDIITVVQTFILVSYIGFCGLLLSDGADEIVVFAVVSAGRSSMLEKRVHHSDSVRCRCCLQCNWGLIKCW